MEEASGHFTVMLSLCVQRINMSISKIFYYTNLGQFARHAWGLASFFVFASINIIGNKYL